MIPLKLSLNNFLGHKESFIDFSLFNSALIIGKDKSNSRKSNGVGKSTIFTAIDYVLYNETPVTMDKIILDGESKCNVTYEFSSNGETYKVSRGRSSANKSELFLFKLLSDGNWESLNQKTNGETENELKKIIKISFKAFKHSIWFSQGDLNGLSVVTPDKRKDLLKEPLNIAIYNRYLDLAKKELSSISKKIELNTALRESLGDPATSISEAKEQISFIKEKLKSLEKDRIFAQGSLDAKNIELFELKKLIDSENINIGVKFSAVKNEKKDAKRDFQKILEQIESQEIKNNNNKNNLTNRISELGTLQDKLKLEKNKEFRSEDNIRFDIDSWAEKESRGKLYIHSLEIEYNKLKKVKITDEAFCDACAQEISQEHKDFCQKKNQERMLELEGLINSSKKKLNVCIEKRNLFENELKLLNKYNSDVVSIEVQISNRMEDIKKSQDVIRQFDEILSSYIENKSKLELKINELESQEETLKELLKKNNVDEINGKIENTNAKIQELNQIIKNNLQENSALNTKLGIFDENIKLKSEDLGKLKTLEKEYSDLDKEVRLYTKIVKAFGSNGIPTLIIHTILDDLQIEANKLLQELRPEISLQFIVSKDNKDTLDIEYYIYGNKRDYNLISGGQKVFIGLVLKLGLSLVIQQRLGVDIKLLEFDEVDMALDDEGIDALVEVIKKLQNRFKILLITHNKYLQTKINNVILVEGNEGFGAKARVVI